jgi:hypothetical protein
MDRHQLWDKRLAYVASLDIESDRLGNGEPGPESVAANARASGSPVAPNAEREAARFCQMPALTRGFRPNSRLYNVLGESRVLGKEALLGTVLSFQERLYLRPEFEIAELEGTWILETDDRTPLWCRYKGVIRPGPLWSAVVRGQRLDSPLPAESTALTRDAIEAAAIPVKTYITARFESGNTKYKWLVERQCAGYGYVHVWYQKVIRSTFDVYALI